MSNYEAIAGVMKTLKNLLKERMEVGVDITIQTPRSGQQSNDANRINLFLYQVTENSTWRNQDIPSLGHPAAYGQPPLALDLHFLLTAYGEESDGADVSDIPSYKVLGSAMRVLHDSPIITEKLRASNGASLLDASLIGQVENLRITPAALTLEDMSKIWTALTLPYRPSVAYQASVVLIESKRVRRYAKLVGAPPDKGPRIPVSPFRHPHINAVRVSPAGGGTERPAPYAAIGDKIILDGYNFLSDSTRVRLGDVDATDAVLMLSDERIDLLLPDDIGLQPGPQPVIVSHDVMLGAPPVRHIGYASNLGVFVLIPSLKEIAPAQGPAGTAITLKGTRLSAPHLLTQVIIGDKVFTPSSANPTQITATIAGLKPETYAVRVRVNGAESLDSGVTFTAT